MRYRIIGTWCEEGPRRLCETSVRRILDDISRFRLTSPSSYFRVRSPQMRICYKQREALTDRFVSQRNPSIEHSLMPRSERSKIRADVLLPDETGRQHQILLDMILRGDLEMAVSVRWEACRMKYDTYLRCQDPTCRNLNRVFAVVPDSVV